MTCDIEYVRKLIYSSGMDAQNDSDSGSDSDSESDNDSNSQSSTSDSKSNHAIDSRSPEQISDDMNRRVSVVTLLLEAHADIEATNKLGSTPLLIATQNGALPLVECLLSHGARVSVSDQVRHDIH